MTTDRPSTGKKRFPLLTVLAALAALGVVLAAGGFTFAANQETHDPFCASCHTQPESTFFQRSTSAQAVDLASFHTTQKTRCIDCHSGPGLFGRMQAELLGARNASVWYLHTATQPAPLTFPIKDANCLKCHQDVTQKGYIPKQAVTIPGGGGRGEARINHWHENLARWQAADPNAGDCTSCHSGHLAGGSAQTGFQIAQTTTNTCDACHRVLRRGGG
jgi:nitrate/TMAO reductase-like tetraheme cytochrome c subunit